MFFFLHNFYQYIFLLFMMLIIPKTVEYKTETQPTSTDIFNNPNKPNNISVYVKV